MADRGLFDKKYHVALLGYPVVATQEPNYTKRQDLGPSFKPSNWDVVCHNSKEYQDHGGYSNCLSFDFFPHSLTPVYLCVFAVGNRRFRICIENHLGSYIKAQSRIAKSAIITNLVSTIRESSTQPGGGFVRYDESIGRWYEVGEKIARDKVGQALRDAARIRRNKRKSVNSSTAAASKCKSVPQVSTDIDSNVQQEQTKALKQHRQDTIGEDRRKMPDFGPIMSPISNNKMAILPISRKCLHVVHETPSMTSRELAYKQLMSDTKRRNEAGGGLLPSNGTGAVASMWVEFNIRSDVTKGIGTADELLEWFEHVI